jgi:hypothetical protein
MTQYELSQPCNLIDLTERLKSALWRCYGSASYASEWDGNVYGGGKLSQRFWEYHQTVELLQLTPDSVVLDIGGGSPATGAGFFTRVIAPYVREVHVMDVNIGESKDIPSNVVMHRSLAGYESLSELLSENPQITHVACISVFEHISNAVRCGMVKALNERFRGDHFVATLEFHAKKCFFEYQLTTQTVSEMFSVLTAFYPDMISKSPFWCEDAYRPMTIRERILYRLGIRPEVPLWYPVACRFRRMME